MPTISKTHLHRFINCPQVLLIYLLKCKYDETIIYKIAGQFVVIEDTTTSVANIVGISIMLVEKKLSSLNNMLPFYGVKCNSLVSLSQKIL